MKKNRLFCSAVIVAAGKGTRMKLDINKQYVHINGEPVLARALKAFEMCPAIDEIILVVNSQEIVYCKQNIADLFGFQKLKAITAGGEQRQNSVYNGLKEISGRCDIVLVHDGARPFVDERTINDCIDAAARYGAACAAVPVKDTIKTGDADSFICDTLDRNSLWSIQTPQAFNFELLKNAHEAAAEDGFMGTDDAVLAERGGKPVKLVMGSYFNIKITTREDLIIAEAIARSLDEE
jgi:2-C-methyl-D-erythritol 4-phosphate cytidylyltransferase